MFEPFKKEIQYSLVVSALEHPKEFPAAGGIRMYSHKVTFRDRFGKDYKGDYESRSSQQSEFVAGSRTTFRVVRFVPGMPPVIEPLMSNGQEPEKKLILSEAPLINGTSYSHAIQISKDLLVAEKSGVLNKVDDDDIDRLLRFADKIEEWFLHKQEQRITDEVGF